ncbi:MAG: hypothetical protein Q9P14_11375 [candidate division KSB1 bacterium]|nr:hypothetical protein [candidate division KSB1 bacterium]
MILSPIEIITRKRNGEKLTEDEIQFIIDGYTRGDIPDYQISALLMAIYFRGMDAEETATPGPAHARFRRGAGFERHSRAEGG